MQLAWWRPNPFTHSCTRPTTYLHPQLCMFPLQGCQGCCEEEHNRQPCLRRPARRPRGHARHGGCGRWGQAVLPSLLCRGLPCMSSSPPSNPCAAETPGHLLIPSLPPPPPSQHACRSQVCVASGRIITKESPHVRCKTCKHSMISAEVRARMSCPLCHSMLPPPTDKSRATGGGVSAQYGAAAGAGQWGQSGYAPINEDQEY